MLTQCLRATQTFYMVSIDAKNKPKTVRLGYKRVDPLQDLTFHVITSGAGGA